MGLISQQLIAIGGGSKKIQAHVHLGSIKPRVLDAADPHFRNENCGLLGRRTQDYQVHVL
jgi:hypothetical protein